LTVVLDTTVLIDVLRGDPAALGYAAGLGEVPACSEITRIEMVRGLRANERDAARDLFQTIDWIPLEEPIAAHAGELGRRFRASHPGIGTSDLAIAATANLLSADLATANVKHFPMFPGLRAPY